MPHALIVGAAGGIGSGFVQVLTGQGWQVDGLSRREQGLDITDADSVERAMAGLTGPYDLVVVATGILAPEGKTPEKSLSAIEADSMAHVMAVNAIGPALILRHLPPLLPRERRAVVAVLTARVGSIGDNHLGGWYAYRAAKAAANQITRTAAIEIARKHKQAVVVALHPGTVETRFTADYPGHKKLSAVQSATHMLAVLEGLGPEHTGQFFDWAGKPVPW